MAVIMLSDFAEQRKAAIKASRAPLISGVILIVVSFPVAAVIPADPTKSIVGTTVGVLGIALVILAFILRAAERQRNRADNRRDFELAKSVLANLTVLGKSVEDVGKTIVEDRVPGMLQLANLRLGELSKHFDKQMTASITGWMDHQLAPHGFGVGVGIGGIGVGVGKVGIDGVSRVDLSMSGVSRDDLLGDGFIAHLDGSNDSSGVPESWRVIVPSEEGARSVIRSYVSGLGAAYGSGSYCDRAIQSRSSTLADSFTTQPSLVSDRLSAVLRSGKLKDVPVWVRGVQVREKTLLASSMKIGEQDDWHSLFPVSLFTHVPKFLKDAETGHELPGWMS